LYRRHPSCSYDGTSYSLLQILLLWDISFSHKRRMADGHQKQISVRKCKVVSTHADHGYSSQQFVSTPYVVYAVRTAIIVTAELLGAFSFNGIDSHNPALWLCQCPLLTLYGWLPVTTRLGGSVTYYQFCLFQGMPSCLCLRVPIYACGQ